MSAAVQGGNCVAVFGSTGLLSGCFSHRPIFFIYIFCLTSVFFLSIYCNYTQFNVVQDIANLNEKFRKGNRIFKPKKVGKNFHVFVVEW